MKDKMIIKFYGTGGSCPVNADRRRHYGGNTSCILVVSGAHGILLDLGTGILELEEDISALKLSHLDILLSHYHYDHIDGFPFIKPILKTLQGATLYGPLWMGNPVEGILDKYMCPPYFPVKADIYEGLLHYCTIKPGESLSLGAINISTHPLNHPDGAIAYRIDGEGKSVVYLLDNEVTEESEKALAEFCKNASLLICDAYFTHSEMANGKYKGWGHSSYEQGMDLAKAAGAKLLALTHHSIARSDTDLNEIEAWVKGQNDGAFLAYDGLEIVI